MALFSTPPPAPPSLGQKAYEAFARKLAVDRNERMVTWAKLAPFARDAWEAAAKAAVDECARRQLARAAS